MKKLKVKSRKCANTVINNTIINYDIKKIITNTGVYSFDDIKFEYIANCYYQYLYVLAFGIVVTVLTVKTNDFITFNYKGQSENTLADRHLEYLIYKYKTILKGGE